MITGRYVGLVCCLLVKQSILFWSKQLQIKGVAWLLFHQKVAFPFGKGRQRRLYVVLEFSWLDLTMGFEACYVARFILSFLLVVTDNEALK